MSAEMPLIALWLGLLDWCSSFLAIALAVPSKLKPLSIPGYRLRQGAFNVRSQIRLFNFLMLYPHHDYAKERSSWQS